MFRSKTHGDVKKSATKILDAKKDTVTRLKHLRIVLDNYEVAEAKNFFEQNYSYIYYIFHDVFTNVEADLKQRANKAHREELDFVLHIFEKILTLLPELIHKRWQYHSIGRLMKKLLHPGNSLKLRREGMRLFLIWYQILMDNATEECHKTYQSLVTKLGAPEITDTNVDIFTVRTFPNTKVTAVEIVPMLLPQSGDKQPDNLTKWLLETLLLYMVSEVKKIEWMNKDMHEFSFNFLFNQFKEFYLRTIFPEFKDTSIYNPCLDLPDCRNLKDADGLSRSHTQALCQEVVVKWLATFMYSSKRPDPPLTSPPLNQDRPPDEDSDVPNDGTLMAGQPSSKESTLSHGTVYTEKDSTGSSVCSDDNFFSEQEIVKRVLYNTRENVNIVHEVFRQAFLFPFHNSGAVRRVISVYKDWFQEKVPPVFMVEAQSEQMSTASPSSIRSTPDNHDNTDNLSHSTVQSVLTLQSDKSHDSVDSGHSSPQKSATSSETSSPAVREVASTADPAVKDQPKTGDPAVRDQPRTGDPALTVPGAGTDSLGNASTVSDSYNYHVKAGLQRVLQVFITNSGNVFLLETSDATMSEMAAKLDEQVDMCKRILNIYRYVVMNHHLEKQTWEQLLLVLLKITSGVLKKKTTPNRDALGGRLAQPLFQTLIVTWIKANLNVHISPELWDHFLMVLSSLTGWEELIREWAKTMETLTRVLARHVYNLDLNDLPLERLSEQKEKRRRGGKPSGGPVKWDNTISRSIENNSSPVRNHSKLGHQRSRSGEVSPIMQSSHTSLQGDVTNLDIGGPLVRSSSDSSLMITDLDLKKGGGEYTPPGADCASLTDEVLGHMGEMGMYFSAPEDVDSDDAEEGLVSSKSSEGLAMIGSPLPTSDSLAHHQIDSTSGLTSGGVGDDQASVSASLTSTVTDNASLASVDSNLPYQIMEHGADSASLLFDRASLGDRASYGDRSETDVQLRISDSGSCESNGMRPSPEASPTMNGLHSESSPESNNGNLPNGDIKRNGYKQSTPTPDRESLRIEEDTDESENNNDKFLDANTHTEDDDRSVVAGGNLTGWTPEVAVILWRRMLGALGDINRIENPEIHAQVYEYLCDLMDLLLKIRDNMGVTKDNLSSPPPPEFLPPVLLFVPWLFEAFTLSGQYKQGKNLSYRLLCGGTVRLHDSPLPNDYLLRFYKALHHGLVHADQDTTNVLVRHCAAKFFSVPLPGSSMMVLDFIHAANTIAASTDLKEAPRAEAMSILGALLSFPEHFGEIPALQPNAKDLTMMQCSDVKDHLINILLKSGKKEPSGLARCVAISSLGVFVYSELSHGTLHPKLREATQVLLSTLKFNNKSVAQVAVDTLVLLCDHANSLLDKQPDLPRKIIEETCKTLSILLSPTEHSNSEEDKRLLVSIMFCLLEWCICLPLPLLLDAQPGQKSLMYKTFRVLNQVVTGTHGQLTPRGHIPPSDLVSQDDDIESLKETSSHSVPSTPKISKTSVDIASEYSARAQRSRTTQGESQAANDNSIIKLAARTVMSRLVNHLGHFPMGAGASQLNSTVQEHHDIEELSLDELNPQIYSAPNVQFFVLNHSTLVSLVEIPALTNLPGGGVTAGLTTGKTLTRVIIRDTSGKFCWDNSILYGPPKCRAGSYPAAPLCSLHIDEGIDLIGQDQCQGQDNLNTPTQEVESSPSRLSGGKQLWELPMFDSLHEGNDGLNHLLGYVGQTSPECVLWPGEPLNQPAPDPDEVPSATEKLTNSVLTAMRECEEDFFSHHKADSSMSAKAFEPMEDRDSSTPYTLCRLFLNQLGFLQWEKRTQFDLLRKTEKLLRDLKHLDSHKCRETYKIAVIYVACGQEDKQSILMNRGGSQAYEEFVAGLGWEVDLELHKGFLGGLQSNRSTGDSAPYYATSTKEVIFHVATRMPCEEGEDKPGQKKVRHLGNDEVQIIWSEHSRDYRRGIIPTEFGDVIIAIYPLQNGLYRIQVNRKPEVPYFGPLFDGAIVDHKVLPGLVRATAVNASQVLRTVKPYYQAFFEERAKYMANIVNQNKELSTFEEFAAQVYAPVFPRDDSNSFSRRLSFGKSKKSSASKQKQFQSSTPPESPLASQKGKR